MANLPQPSKTGRSVAALTAAICADLLPLGGTLREVFAVYEQKKINEYRRVLVEEIEAFGVRTIDGLSEAQAEFVVPAAYRFFEQVRLGEYEHNLRILARFIGGSLADRSTTKSPGDIGRFARQLEYLDEYCLRVLSAALRLREKIPNSANAGEPFIASDSLIHHFSEFSETDAPRIRTCLAMLSSRGFLYPDGGTSTGKVEEDYYLSEDASELAQYLQSGESK